MSTPLVTPATGQFTQIAFLGGRDKRTHFSVGLPSNAHTAIPVPTRVNALTPFQYAAVFKTAEPDPITIEILTATLQYDVNSTALVTAVIRNCGWTIVSRKDLKTAGGWDSELIAEFDVDGTDYVARIRAVGDGERLFLVIASTAFTVAEKYRERLCVAPVTFQLIHPENKLPFTVRTTVQPSTDRHFRFELPAAWVAEETLTQAGMHRFNNRLGGSTIGQMAIREVPANQTNFALLRGWTQELERQGYRLSGSPTVDVPPAGGFDSAKTFAPPSTLNGADTAVMAYVATSGERRIFVGMQSPAAKDQPLIFLLNQRAFEVVRDSLRFT
jgi:hypothetical protein